MATSEFLTELLAGAPNVKCFVIVSNEVALQNSQQLPSRVARPHRKKAAKKFLVDWKRRVKEIIQSAETRSFDETVAAIESLPLNAARLVYDPYEADILIDEISSQIQTRQCGIGVWEQFASEEIVFIWLWRDV